MRLDPPWGDNLRCVPTPAADRADLPLIVQGDHTPLVEVNHPHFDVSADMGVMPARLQTKPVGDGPKLPWPGMSPDPRAAVRWRPRSGSRRRTYSCM